MEYKTVKDLKLSRLAIGCMRIAGKSVDEVEALIDTALKNGINFFDHADIYGGGKSEEVFGKVLEKRPELREKMIIQTKCAIVPGKRYDFSKEYIINAVNGSLERLHTDYVDILLLHRPDALADWDEVSEAFDQLFNEGKVKYFGVSNFSTMQMKLMKKYVKQPVLFNQLQYSVVHCPSVDAGFHANMRDDYACDRDGGSVFDYCQLEDVTVQAWSVIQASWAEGSFLDHPDYGKLNETLQALADEYNVTKATIAIAWILRHPAKIIPILGSTNPVHIEEMAKAIDVKLTRQQWYDLYLSVDKPLP